MNFKLDVKKPGDQETKQQGDQVTKLQRIRDTWSAFFGPSAEFNYAGQIVLFPVLLAACVTGSLCDLLFLRH